MNIWTWLQDVIGRVRWMDVLVSAGIMALFVLLNRFVVRYVFSLVDRRNREKERTLMWREALEKPLRLFVVVLGVYLGLKYLLSVRWETNIALDGFFRSAVILLIGWSLLILSNRSSFLLEQLSKKIRLDDSSMLIPFMSKVLRFVVIVLTITLIGAEWGFSINGLVAGMGLGSLAIALAAKDTLGNIFGGIVIILEKPFSRGDWVLTPSVEGFVEDITFRRRKSAHLRMQSSRYRTQRWRISRSRIGAAWASAGLPLRSAWRLIRTGNGWPQRSKGSRRA